MKRKAKASGSTRELASPPGKVVWWALQVGEEYQFSQGKTAFEATAKIGLLLSQCSDIHIVAINQAITIGTAVPINMSHSQGAR